MHALFQSSGRETLWTETATRKCILVTDYQKQLPIKEIETSGKLIATESMKKKNALIGFRRKKISETFIIESEVTIDNWINKWKCLGRGNKA